MLAWNALSHRALYGKLCEPKKQEQRVREELARSNEELKNELEEAKEKTTMLKGDWRREETSQATKGRPAKKKKKW